MPADEVGKSRAPEARICKPSGEKAKPANTKGEKAKKPEHLLLPDEIEFTSKSII
jgi:hypothetical protein